MSKDKFQIKIKFKNSKKNSDFKMKSEFIRKTKLLVFVIYYLALKTLASS
jgi:hypothetical protein